MTDRAEQSRRELIDRLGLDSMIATDPLAVTCTVKTSPETVWMAIERSGNLTDIHPFCAENPVERWPGEDGRDEVHYYSGLVYERDVLTWREGLGYDLAVGPPAGKLAIARWLIEPLADNRCDFTIEVTSFARADVPAERREAYISEVIRRQIPPYLNGVVRGVAHFAETGEPVRRNQFGAHPIYSPG